MKLMIDVGDKFKSQDFPISPALQPSDYTAYPAGERKPGVISQVGDIVKKKADARSYKTLIAVNVSAKGGTSPVAVGTAKPYKGNVFLAAVDRFFDMVNGAIG